MREDIHPGHRFIKILETIKTNRLPMGEDPITFRHVVRERFDALSAILHWPSLAEMTDAMSVAHHVEQLSPVTGPVVPHKLRDPYILAYQQINEARRINPWCDIMPGRELFHTPLLVPVIISRGKISVRPDDVGTAGFMVFAAARILDLVVFGECGPLVNALFGDDELREPLTAVCERLGLIPDQIRDAWLQICRVDA